MSKYVEHLAANGGMATCGEHLGVMVGTDEFACPAGWVFVPLEGATTQIVSEALAVAKKGRAGWPEKVVYEKPRKQNQKKGRNNEYLKKSV